MRSTAVCHKKPDIGLGGFEIGKRYKVERIRTHKNIYFKVYYEEHDPIHTEILTFKDFTKWFVSVDERLTKYVL